MRPSAPALVLVLTLAVPATAARPACRLVGDARGDTRVVLSMTAPVKELVASALDIVSADVATDRRTVAVAIRVADLTLPNPALPDGARYGLSFRTAGAIFALEAYAVQGRTGAEVYWIDTTLAWQENLLPARARVTFDQARDEVRISAPLSALASVVDVPDVRVLSELVAHTWRQQSVRTGVVQEVRRTSVADDARGTRSYRARTPSCLKPGS